MLRVEDLAQIDTTVAALVGPTSRFFVVIGGEVVGDRLLGGVLRALTLAEMEELFVAADPQGFAWRGEYDAEEAYEAYDVVRHEGSAYVCLLANDDQDAQTPGAAPTYWELFAAGIDLPAVPETGTHTLKAVDGVLTWVEDE